MDYYQPFSKIFKLVADARFRLNSYDGFSPVADPCGLTVLHLISIILKCTNIIRKALFEINVIRKFSETSLQLTLSELQNSVRYTEMPAT